MESKELEKIEKIIESSHINFMIGSGTSRDYLDTLANIETLLTELEKDTSVKSLPNFKLLETSIKYWYFDKCMRGNLKIVDENFKLQEGKETQFQETSKNYDEFIKAINIILLKRKTSLLNKQVNLFTTNMDLFLDKTLDKKKIEFNDGFSGKFEPTFNTSNYQKTILKNSSQYDVQSELPLFNLFKLHGSLAWRQIETPDKKHIITYDPRITALATLNEITFDVQTEILPLKSEYSELVTELKEDKYQEVKLANHDKFLAEYDNLIMINPTKEKFASTTLRLEYYEQLRMYSNALEKENSVLFVCGFSFADEHLKEITLRAANSNPTLIIYIFCFDEDAKEYIMKNLDESKFNNIKYLVGFSFAETTNKIFVKIAQKLDSKSYNLNHYNTDLESNPKNDFLEEKAIAKVTIVPEDEAAE